MTNVSQAIHVQVQLPDAVMHQFENALAELRTIADEFPQLREGLALRALRELWPPSIEPAANTAQLTLLLSSTVHALSSVGTPGELREHLSGLQKFDTPPNCKAKLVEGQLLCDQCAFKFTSVDSFRCMK